LQTLADSSRLRSGAQCLLRDGPRQPLKPVTELPSLLRILCDASEFDELPVRHNEEHVHEQMARELPWTVDQRALDSPHVKANLLFQAHFARAPLPMSDYVTDTKTVLDNAVRVLQAMVDIAADGGWMPTALGAMRLAQMVTQARWPDDDGLTDLPHVDASVVKTFASRGVTTLRQLQGKDLNQLRELLRGTRLAGQQKQIADLHGVLRTLPAVRVKADAPPKPLAPNAEGKVSVTLQPTNPASRRKAFAPRFPKPKLAGWWLAMAEEEELIALKRVHLDRSQVQAELSFAAPEEPGEYYWTVHLVSDSYLGLDQTAEVCVVVE